MYGRSTASYSSLTYVYHSPFQSYITSLLWTLSSSMFQLHVQMSFPLTNICSPYGQVSSLLPQVSSNILMISWLLFLMASRKQELYVRNIALLPSSLWTLDHSMSSSFFSITSPTYQRDTPSRRTRFLQHVMIFCMGLPPPPSMWFFQPPQHRNKPLSTFHPKKRLPLENYDFHAPWYRIFAHLLMHT